MHTLHYMTLHDMTLHYITIITLYYITLHTLHIYIYYYIYIYILLEEREKKRCLNCLPTLTRKGYLSNKFGPIRKRSGITGIRAQGEVSMRARSTVRLMLVRYE